MPLVSQLLGDFQDVFAKHDGDLRRTKSNTPLTLVTLNRYAKRPDKRNESHEEIKRMLDNGVIEPSVSPWASPIVLLCQKDGGVRFCVDYRQLNAVTIKDAFPLPREDNIDALSGPTWFSSFDLASGYRQVSLDEKDKKKTAFATYLGLYQSKVLPFGLCNAPGTFQRLMQRVLVGLQWESDVLNLDDIVVFGQSFSKHLKRLRKVLERLRGANLKVKPQK